VEEVLEKRWGDFLRYCLSQSLTTEQMDRLLDCIDVEVTTQRREITERSLIILMFNKQSTFPIEQVRLWVIQISAIIAIRSKNPIHDRIHWCPLTNYDPTDTSISQDPDRIQACSVVETSSRGLTCKDRITHNVTSNRPGNSEEAGTICEAEATCDQMCIGLFKSIAGLNVGTSVSDGTILQLSLIKRNDRSKRSAACENILLRGFTGTRKSVSLVHHEAAELAKSLGDDDAITDIAGGPIAARRHRAAQEKKLEEIQEYILLNLQGYLGGCQKIVESMAETIWNTRNDMHSDEKRNLLHKTIEAAVTAWADTALLPDRDLNALVIDVRPHTSPDDTSPKRPGKHHCILMGLIACFAHCDVRSDHSRLADIIIRLLHGLIIQDPKAKRMPKALRQKLFIRNKA